jgi:hypothetical protein
MTIAIEIWKDIEGYEGFYQVSNLGNVKSFDRKVWNGCTFYDKPGRILKPIRVGEYLGVQLSHNARTKKFYVHRLVATAFLEKSENRNVVNHKDGDKFNNTVENLEWCTARENNDHATNHGLRGTYGEDNPVTKYSNETVIKMRTDYETGLYTQADIARKYGVSKMQTNRILKYKLRKDVI